MKNAGMLALLVLLCHSAAAATGQAGQAHRFQFSPGALLRAKLDGTIDANKTKVGDPVVAKLTDGLKLNGEVLAAANSRILGHITQAAQHQGASPSVIGIAFDKLILKDGSDVPLNVIIQAIGFPDPGTGTNSDTSGASSPGVAPGEMGGPGGTMGQPDGYYGGTMPRASGDESAAKLSPSARGVVGISGASLSAGAAQESLITSPKHNVKIENGAQMILCVQ